MKRHYITLILAACLILAAAGTALAGNPNPRVIPNKGPTYAMLGAKWWQWAYSFPRAEVPFFNTGGPVDISAGQLGHVWFLAGANSGPATRTGTVPARTTLFFPLFNYLDDYPCPDPNFKPDPGETLEHFLQRDANNVLDYCVPDVSELFAEIDGVALTNLSAYRATSRLFKFTADSALAPDVDACITGGLQDGVAVGYWLLLPPLTPGKHTLHFGARNSPCLDQDVTYVLTVTPGR